MTTRTFLATIATLGLASAPVAAQPAPIKPPAKPAPATPAPPRPAAPADPYGDAAPAPTAARAHFDLAAVQGLLAVQRLDGWLLSDDGAANPIARRLVNPDGAP